MNDWRDSKSQPEPRGETRNLNEGQAIAEVRQVPEIREDNWPHMDADQRQIGLQDAENRMARVQGREPCVVNTKKAGGVPWNVEEQGYFDPKDKTIYVNPELVNSDNPREALNTLAHEGRHAYQHHTCDHPGTHPDPKQAAEWRHNFENYISPQECLEGYWNQPVERDARAYGDAVANGVYGGSSNAKT